MNFFRLKVFFNISQIEIPHKSLAEASRWLYTLIIYVLLTPNETFLPLCLEISESLCIFAA